MAFIEVVIVLVILGIALVPLSRLSITNLNRGGECVTMTRALFHAQEVMEQIAADYAAVNASRGYTWVRTNWPGSTPNPPSGLVGSVTISGEQIRDAVTYVVVQVTVHETGSEGGVVLTTWLVEND